MLPVLVSRARGDFGGGRGWPGGLWAHLGCWAGLHPSVPCLVLGFSHHLTFTTTSASTCGAPHFLTPEGSPLHLCTERLVSCPLEGPGLLVFRGTVLSRVCPGPAGLLLALPPRKVARMSPPSPLLFTWPLVSWLPWHQASLQEIHCLTSSLSPSASQLSEPMKKASETARVDAVQGAQDPWLWEAMEEGEKDIITLPSS